MAKQFYILLYCKPYVKKFLEINFGNPVVLDPDMRLKEFFRSLLKSKNAWYDKKYKDQITHYTESIDVAISEDDFNRYGWELTKTATIAFNQEISSRAKLMMRTFISIDMALSKSIKLSIYRFQDQLSFSEDIWPAESIKRDFGRYRNRFNYDFSDDIYQSFEKKLLLNLLDFGTISSKALEYYENNSKTVEQHRGGSQPLGNTD